jgi:hypothetical protein
MLLVPSAASNFAENRSSNQKGLGVMMDLGCWIFETFRHSNAHKYKYENVSLTCCIDSHAFCSPPLLFHGQWYYFAASNTRKGQKYTFRIINLNKRTSMYKSGLRPLLYSENTANAPDGTAPSPIFCMFLKYNKTCTNIHARLQRFNKIITQWQCRIRLA